MASKMLKFIRGKGQQPSAERQKLQRELFAFRKTVQHGFPHRASALAWEPLLRLAALGTATGALKVYGRPGVEFYGQHTNAEAAVTQLKFIPGTGRVISLCDDNSLHLWEINDSSLVEVKGQSLEGKLKKISAMCVESSGEHLLLGTEGGNIYLLDLNTFTMTDTIIYQDIVMQNCPEDFKVSPGAVECLAQHPRSPARLLIGYSRGLIVLWDRSAAAATHTFVSSQQLESVCWSDDGEQFTSSHNDGSYVTWEMGKPLQEPVTPYGPYPCKAITKILNRTTPTGEPITIFAGGMPRSAYADKFTVTVQQGEKHVAFDFTSRVIDFFTMTPVPAKSPDSSDSEVLSIPRPTCPAEILPPSVQQTAGSVLVLTEEELVVLDLADPQWRPIQLPYLVSLHASAVTCTQLVDGVANDVYDNIRNAGLEQIQNTYSGAPWPITGGSLVSPSSDDEAHTGHQLLLTGHEDGTIRFWNTEGVALVPLYRYTTANIFSGEDITETDAVASDEEDWPPFKRVGSFDPYSDDPRLAVKKVMLCPLSGVLAVAGAAGHVVVSELATAPATKEVKAVAINIVSDRDGFVWKGHDQLNIRAGQLAFPEGFQVSSVVQLHPPAAVTALALQAEWGLLGAGTAHGLVLYDIVQCSSVAHRCTLNPNDHSGTGDTPISRRKSFKKSLRESFRRLRKGRSQRRQTTTNVTTTPSQQPAPKRTGDAAGDPSPVEARPVERPVEARPTDDGFGSMVRCLYFARTYLLNSQTTTPTLWAGTNNGTVYAFSLTVPNTNKRKTEHVNCQLAKEIQLKHRAPVIGITVLDGASIPLPEPLEVERGISPLPDSSAPQRVLIASEEQFKLFTLPALKPYHKYKLTAHEGARVRRMSFGWFSCTVDGVKHSEVCLLCLTNLGDCLVLSVPELRRQLNAAAVRKEDINGISSLSFSKRGEALYLHSSSELQRITVSASKVTKACCHLSLPAWAQALRGPIDPQVNGDHQVEGDAVEVEAATEEANPHDVTATSHNSHNTGDITVDSVRDHTGPELNINLQNTTVNQTSMVVKSTTRTTLGDTNGTDTPTTTTTTATSTVENNWNGDGPSGN